MQAKGVEQAAEPESRAAELVAARQRKPVGAEHQGVAQERQIQEP